MNGNKLPENEYFIMQIFWQQGALKTDQLNTFLTEKNWKPTTILTFLSRLSKKGFLKIEKQGKSNLYIPIISKEFYLQNQTQEFLQTNYNGDAKMLIASMVDSKKITAEDIHELYLWLEKKENSDE